MTTKTPQITEVVFAEHVYEFNRFYKNHQRLNEEIAGLREKRFYELGVEKIVVIKRENFLLGIKNLQAFMIDNLHYIKRYQDMNYLLQLFEELEEDFNFDEQYQRIARKVAKGIQLTKDEDMDLNILYLEYLTRCFELSYKLNIFLQTTLMINIKNKKDLIFREESQFYISLSTYRDFLVDDLANYRVKNTIEHYKRVLGYYYTYKVLFLSEESVLMDQLLHALKELILSKEGIEIIKSAEDLQKNKAKTKDFGVIVKFALCKIYAQTNSFLSERNVLPKRKKKDNMDFTLI